MKKRRRAALGNENLPIRNGTTNEEKVKGDLRMGDVKQLV